MEKAYMIRNDGKAIPVVQHPYGNVDEVTEMLYAAEWYFNNSLSDQHKYLFIKLIAAYARFYVGLTSSETLISDLCEEIKAQPYKYLSTGFVESHSLEILATFETYAGLAKSAGKKEIRLLSEKLVEYLNQEFLRARYGGLYNTDSSSREMVFRVSSSGFNWYSIIWSFVYENKRHIDCVTIVRDEESTGINNFFYRAKDGMEYNRYPVDQFLTESGEPVIETTDPVRKFLLSGRPLCEMYDLPMNRERIEYRYRCIINQENRERTFWLRTED